MAPIKLHPGFAVRPGAWLRAELVETRGLTVTEAAAKLHVTRQAMSDLPGSWVGLLAETAIWVEKALGERTDMLMQM